MDIENNEFTQESDDKDSGTKSRQKLKKFLIPIILFLCVALAAGIFTVYADGNSKQILINEVMSSNSQTVNAAPLGSPDWIELYNVAGSDVKLKGYKLKDKTGIYVFGDTVIKAGGYLIVYAEKNIPQAEGLCCADFNISGSGDVLCLLDKNDAVLDQIIIPELASDESYARRDDGTYGICTNATPGAVNENGSIITEEELQNKLSALNVVISEVLPKGTDGSWIELYNSGKEAADLQYFCLSDSESDPTKWHMPETMLGPGEYAVVHMSDSKVETALKASFNLGSRDSGAYLYDISGVLKSSLKWASGMTGGVSVVRDYTYSLDPTMGAANSPETFSSMTQAPMDSSDPVRINETLSVNKYGIADSDGNRYGWVELYNGSSQSVPMKQYYLSDDSGDLLKWAFPDTDIEPGGYMTVFLTGETDKQQELHASFRLSGDETNVFLTNLNGMRVDTFKVPEGLPEDVSAGRDSGGGTVYYTDPTPGEANSEGRKDKPQISRPDKNGVYISEVSAASEAKSHINDWIELHNGSKETVNLEGYYLSDDAKNIKEWKIGALNIAAGGYTVIEASSSSGDAGTADFGISPSGETLFLSDQKGTVIDVFDTGVLSPGLTSGRMESGDSAERVFFATPTRGEANSKDYKTGYTATPEFSEAGLYQTTAFSLAVTCADPKAKIYYTTNGFVPTSASTPYTGPINISKNTVIRAIACGDNLLPSGVKTSTYIFDAPHTLPVFCISGDPGKINIILHVNRIGDKPEYPVYVEYYEKDGTVGVSFPSGVRPKGRASLANPQKSLTMALRSDYGQKNITYPFFPESSIKTYTTLTLRDSGQDNRAARMRDSYFQKVAKGLDLDTIDTKPVVVYINGAYYGLGDLDEEQNPDYLASHHNLDPNKIDMIDRNGTIISGDNAEFKHIMSMARTIDTSDDKNFDEFTKYVDADACMDYLIAQIYFGNGDVINQRFWRAQDYSVKWRPLLFDLDWSFRFNDPGRDKFSRYFSSVSLAGNGAATDMYIFCALKRNKGWSDKFVERFVQLAETQFSPNRMLSIFDDTVNTMQPEMPLHIARFHTPGSMASWLKQTSSLRAAVAKRQTIALKQLQQFFHVSNEKMQELINKYSAKS